MAKMGPTDLIGLRSQPHSGIAVGPLLSDWSITVESRATPCYLHNSAAGTLKTVGTLTYDWSVGHEWKQKIGHNEEIIIAEIKPRMQTGFRTSQGYYRLAKGLFNSDSL